MTLFDSDDKATIENTTWLLVTNTTEKIHSIQRITVANFLFWAHARSVCCYQRSRLQHQCWNKTIDGTRFIGNPALFS